MLPWGFFYPNSMTSIIPFCCPQTYRRSSVRRQFVVGLLLLLAIPAPADQIVLKNGDKLTGSITKSDGKELVIKTDYAGDVTVKFDAIQSLTSTGDLNVTLGGRTAVGPITTSGDNVIVATKTAGPLEAPKASLTLLRSPAAQHKNKEKAMSMLRSKIYEFELEKKREVTKKIEDSKLDIDFGSQIRSYVLQPYRMIKDHRTKLEIGDVDRVIDGDLRPLMQAYLRMRRGEKKI